MKILLTGASGYIGLKLLPVLIRQGHQVVCCVRDLSRFQVERSFLELVNVIEVDFLDKSSLSKIPKDIDAAYYLIHSMSSVSDYARLELMSATYFREALIQTHVKQVIYLSGIINEETLSEHLASRKEVENELAKGSYHFTTLRAGIIIGSGSASFEIMRDLVEKLPVMIAPKWLLTRCQPISIHDVIEILTKTLLNEITYDKSFDIGGPDVLTYKEMLLGYSRVRGLKRSIYIIPVFTPRISSYWLFFITSTSFKLATALVSSMKVEVVCRNDEINHLLNISPITYEEAVQNTFSVLENNSGISDWDDPGKNCQIDKNLSEFIKVPGFGCIIDLRSRKILNFQKCEEKLWNMVAGKTWYKPSWEMKFFNSLDRLFAGNRFRNKRIADNHISQEGEIDFWRVLYKNRAEGRIIIYYEKKLFGDVWFEYYLKNENLFQYFVFRPKGLFGRMYWYMKYPLHKLILREFINELVS